MCNSFDIDIDNVNIEREPNDERALPSSLARTILDSSVTSETFSKKDILKQILNDYLCKNINAPKSNYGSKILCCGSTFQLFDYSNTIFNNLDDYESLNKKEKNICKHHISINEDELLNLNNYYSNCKELNICPANVCIKLSLKIKNYIKLEKIKNEERENNKYIYDIRNINVSRNKLCRLILTNFQKMKTFITLTFEKNIIDVDIAMKEFHKFCVKVRRIYKEFMYIGVIEFQKNGRIHFHILTNIDYDNILINENITLNKAIKNGLDLEQFKEENIKLLPKEKMNNKAIVLRMQNGKLHNTKKIWNKRKKRYEIFKTMNYWKIGFSQIKPINIVCNKDNSANGVASYMGKYLTKGNVDEKLFGKKKFFCSQNIIRPKELKLNQDTEIYKYIIDILEKNAIKTYKKPYFDKFGNIILFKEFVMPKDWNMFITNEYKNSYF